MTQITITVNGSAEQCDLDPRELLLHFLRDGRALNGTQPGCDTGECDACTVLIDGMAVKSCSLLAVQADGASITTIEGLGVNGDLHPKLDATFDYLCPNTLEEAVATLVKHGDSARVLAGGHSLLPAIKLRISSPKHLVDLRCLTSLVGTQVDGESIRIGAMTTCAALLNSSDVRTAVPMLANALPGIGDPQIRNRGTLGGSLVHADPAADLPAIMLATDAVFTVVGPKGSRAIAAADFFVEAFRTVIAPNELLTEIRIPAIKPQTGSVYVKRPLPSSRFTLVGAAAVITLSEDGRTIKRARLAITGIGRKASRARSAEASLLESIPNIGSIHGAALLAADEIQPRADRDGDVSTKRNLTAVFAELALNEAVRLAAR